MILLIDNYDSFSYNLYQFLGEINPDIKVIRNDELTVDEIEELSPSHIILSPGPGRPDKAGVCEQVVRQLGGKIPILGVCLGHQAICEAFGATVGYAKKLMHGKQSEAKIDVTSPLYHNIDGPIQVARYHSLAVTADTMPDELKMTAVTSDGEIMSVEHREKPVFGVQYHPESILTPQGKKILMNFLNITTEKGDKEMIKEAIAKLSRKEDLSSELTEQVMDEIMNGEATDAQKGAFLMGLSMKGETIEEITAAAKSMRRHCARFLNDRDVLEIVGTGGDGSNTFNISTAASIVSSAAGIPVAKHGNRAASSKCGTADCLEALGVNIGIDPMKSGEILGKINLCFLFAQKYHPAMRFVGSARREMGVRTLFNILGPLANPAGASMQLLGVYSEDLVEPLAHVLHNLGVKSAMVVYGEDSIDEISLSAPTKVCEFKGDDFKTYVITPEQFGLNRCEKSELVGGTPQENAEIINDIFNGAQSAKRDAVLINAGAAIYVAGGASSIENGIEVARDIIDSGKAKAQLEAFVRLSNG